VGAAPDVIVVGAGLVGAMTAVGLADAGLRVELIECDFPGGGSTGAAMGHIVAMDDSVAQLELCAHSRRRWGQLASELPERAELDRCGTLWIAADEAELEAGRARQAGYAAARVGTELVDANALRSLEPQLRPGLAGGLLVPGDAVCYPPAVARHLVERAAAAGVIVRQQLRVQAVAPNAVQLVDQTRLPAGAVVVAAGVGSMALVPGLPIVPRRGHLVITDRRPRLIRHQLIELDYLQSAHTFGGASVAFNLQPRRTGQVLIGSSRELVGFDAQINHRLLGAMVQRAADFVPALRQARALRSWVGFRPATADKLPLIGPWPAIAGVWIAAGHEGLGITMSTGTADLIVAGIMGSAPPVDPTPFRPDRAMPAMEHAA
jgi:glycine/D-amino acid oxidase-like deaminating enzyme